MPRFLLECRVESIECRCGPRICARFYYRCGIKFPSAEGWAKPGVVYSIAHARSNSYVPVASV